MNSTDYDEIAECGEWDYSWHIGMLLRRKSDGQLLFGSASGCSCYGFWDTIEESDLRPVASWQGAVELAKAEFTDSDVAQFAATLMDLPATTQSS